MMKIQKGTVVRMINYALFGFAMFLFFFFLTFPFDLLEKKLLVLLEEESGCVVTINESEYAVPLPSITWHGIQGHCPKNIFLKGGTGQIAFKVRQVMLDLSPLPLLMDQRAEIDFKTMLGNGVLEGHLSGSQGEKGFSYSLDFEGRDLNSLTLGTKSRLAVKGNGEWTGRDMVQGKGVLSFTLGDAQFKEIGSWTSPVGEIPFSKISGDFHWGNQQVVVDQLSANGKIVDVQSGSGTLRLRQPFERSLLSLNLKATPKGALTSMTALLVPGYAGRKPLTIRINGPWQLPQVSVEGKRVPLGF